MQSKISKHPLWFSGVLVVLLISLILTVTLAVMLGPVSIAPTTVWNIAFSHLPGMDSGEVTAWSKAEASIIWNIRFPRVLMGVIVGAGLSTAGVAIQALIRNSLADPYILGVSSGASVTASMVILFGSFGFLGAYSLPLAAFLGSLLAMGLVFSLARVGRTISTTRLLLAGVAVSMMLSAVTSFIVTLTPQDKGVRDVMFWMMGSLSGAKWEYVLYPSLIVLLCSLMLFFQYRGLNTLLMGEDEAVTLGINMRRFRLFLVLISALVTGTIVAISGTIGFVGLMVPHIVRLLVGSDHRRVLPVSLLLGAIFVVWADVFARLVLAPQEVPIGIVTALCGGPFFIGLLRRSSYNFGGGQ
ncbi:FecCD family ABC transporter permease [Paenibacillus sp. FSL L8-0709]|uniref:FecCD family ABC transporter permease n=1 Tax=Paenibacillus sp. FSL L8-0709 TaxID=2975312 RepID=UPI0030F963AC